MLPTDMEERQATFHIEIYDRYAKKSPYYEETLKRVKRKCDEYNFRTASDDIVLMCALSYPLLSSENLYVVSSIIVFLWEIDDVFDNPTHLLKIRQYQSDSIYSAIREGVANPYTPAADYFLSLLAKIKNNSFKKYLKKTWLDYLDGVQCRIGHYNEILDPEDYINYRKDDSACYLAFTLLFIDVDDFETYQKFIESDDGNAIWELCRSNTVIIYDILSLKKDKKMGTNFNIVISWVEKYKQTEEESIQILINKATKQFEQLIALRNKNFGKVGQDVVNKNILWTSGNAQWAVTSPRYY